MARKSQKRPAAARLYTLTHEALFAGYVSPIFSNLAGRIQIALIDYVARDARIFCNLGDIVFFDASIASYQLPFVLEILREPQACCDYDREYVDESFSIRLPAGVAGNRFAAFLESQFGPCPDLFSQVYEIGASINRRSYDNFIYEFSETGKFTIFYQGRAECRNGVFQFFPEMDVVQIAPKGESEFLIFNSGGLAFSLKLSSEAVDLALEMGRKRHGYRLERGPLH